MLGLNSLGIEQCGLEAGTQNWGPLHLHMLARVVFGLIPAVGKERCDARCV